MAERENARRGGRRGNRRRAGSAAAALAVLIAAGILLWRGGVFEERAYTSAQLGIEEVRSSVDYDGDGVEDYADMVAGVRAYFETDPHYKSAYYAGGYPTDGYGVCTDVIWHAFQAAGYDLKAMVDEDVAANPERYPHIKKRDPNIDFRRVRTLERFFAAYAQPLTTDLTQTEQWQAGDIVIFGANEHIGICSDLRSRRGIPLLLHHGNAIDDAVERNDIPKKTVTAHYRWPG